MAGAVGMALDALRRHGPELSWENELSTLPPSLALELRRWRFHSPDVEVRPGHPTGMGFAQTWWLPFALWDDLAFAQECSPESLAAPPLLDAVRRKLNEALGEVVPSLTTTRAAISVDTHPPLDVDLTCRAGLPPDFTADGSLGQSAPLRLQRGQRWLNAGVIPLTLRASTSATLAWVGTWLARVLDSATHARGRLGPLSDLHSALAEAGMLRWEMWSTQLLFRAKEHSSSLAMRLTVVRRQGHPMELSGVAQETEGTAQPCLWHGHVNLFDDPALLRRALEPWLSLDMPSVRVQMDSVDDAVPFLPHSWNDSFDPGRHRLH